MKCLREWVEKNHQPFVSECVCVGVQMKWKSERQRLDVCVKWGILSCYEFGMFWDRKVHVGFSTGWCVHTQRVRRALHHPPITTAPTTEKKHVISFAGSYMHNTQILCSLCKFLSLFPLPFFSWSVLKICFRSVVQRFRCHSCTANIHVWLSWTTHTHTKNQMKEATERKKKRA